MFKFSNIKKLFKYDWIDVFKNILPKGKNGNLTDEEQNTLKISSILGIAASALVVISVVAAIYNSYMSALGSLAKYLKIGFFDIVSFGDILWTIIKCAIIPIGVLIYDLVMGKKEQNGWVIFSMFILVTLWVVYSFYEGVSCIKLIGYAPISVIIGLVGSLASLVAGGNMVTVFIDYSERYNKGNVQPAQAAPVNGGYTVPTENANVNNTYTAPAQEQQNVQPEQPQQKVCPQCGYLVKADAEFCSMCGHRF